MSTKKKRPQNYVVQDRYFLEAKRLGYRARSAFKLLEIQERFGIAKPGMRVFDLASAPGSFLQVLSKIVGPTGMVVGMDIQKIVPLGGAGNVRVFQGDVFDKETVAKAAVEAMADLEKRSGEAVEPSETVSPSPVSEGSNPKPVFDLMTSDIAPSTTGMTGVDQYRSIELNLAILEIADTFLKKGGNLVLKVFVGEDVDELVGPTKARFTKLVRIKPKACRDRSFEEYFVCFGKK